MWSPLHGAEHDGRLSPWQEGGRACIIPDTHKNGCANDATTGSSRRCFGTLRGSACRINKTDNDVELAAVEFDLDPPEHVMSLFSSPRLTRRTRGLSPEPDAAPPLARSR